MKLRSLAIAAAAFVAMTNVAGAAFAQTKVFIIDEAKIRQETKVGKEMNTVLDGFVTQGAEQLGLKTMKTELDTEVAALKPQTQSLTPEAINANPTLKARVDGLNKKANEYMQKQNLLGQNLEQREQSLNAAFLVVLAPAVDEVAKSNGADIVLSSSSIWYAKDATDLTSKVIARLDATVPTLAALQAALPQPPAQPATKPAGTQ
jgi:Skp family chaperone for outer membrane proteins